MLSVGIDVCRLPLADLGRVIAGGFGAAGLRVESCRCVRCRRNWQLIAFSTNLASARKRTFRQTLLIASQLRLKLPKRGLQIMRYELSDYEWRVIGPMLPNKPRGIPRV